MTHAFRQRGGIPSGSLIGRVSKGRGDAQTLSLAQLRRMGLAPGSAAASSAPNSVLAGTGVTVTDNGDGTVTVAASAAGSVGPRQGSVTKPLKASFTQVNFAGSTSSADGAAGITLTDTTPTTVTNAWRLMEQTAALPATPYDLYAHVGYLSGQQSGAGLTLRNSSSGKFIFIGRRQGATNVSVWSSFSVNAANRMDNPGPGQEWLRLHNDGTNITAFMSSNGLDWQLLVTEALASFLVSVDKAGFGFNDIVAASPVSQIGMLCDSFGFAAPT